MNPSDTSHGGLWSLAKASFQWVVGTVEQRMERLAAELQEEKLWLVQAMVYVGATAALGFVALMLITAAVIVALWETAPVVTLAALGTVYLAASLLVWRALQRHLRSPRPFSGTRADLRRSAERAPQALERS